MKASGPGLLSTLILVLATYQLPTNSSAGPEHDPAMQIQGQPIEAWVAGVKVGGIPGQPDSSFDVLVSAGPKIMTNLADILVHDPSTTQKTKAAWVMGAIAYHNPGAPELSAGVPALASAAENDDLQVRLFAIQGLGAIGEAASNTIPLLIRSAKDDDSGVRMSAVEALGRIGIATPQVVKALKAGMSDRSGDVCITSLLALARIGQYASNSIPVLVRLTKDSSVGVRCAAVEALGRFGANSPEAAAALRVALDDPNEGVRNLAHDALRKVEAHGS